MERLFPAVLRMSLTGSLVIVAVLAARLILRRAPKKYTCLLWSVVAFRLACPVSFSSAWSLFNLLPGGSGVDPHPITNGAHPGPAADAALQAPGYVLDGMLSAPSPVVGPDPVRAWLLAGSLVWCAGMVALLAVGAVQYARTLRRVQGAMHFHGSVWECDVPTPFILGFVKPRIYIPFGLDAPLRALILRHERIHLRRGDHLIKSAAYLLLIVHWFNPLCWLAFALFDRDLEMSCDEALLAEGGDAVQYSTALLSFAAKRRFPTPNSLAFGETGVKARIQNALRFQKPHRLVTAACIVLCLVILAGCAANPTLPRRVDMPGIGSTGAVGASGPANADGTSGSTNVGGAADNAPAPDSAAPPQSSPDGHTQGGGEPVADIAVPDAAENTDTAAFPVSLVWPVPGTPYISRSYGESTIYGVVQFHPAVDIAGAGIYGAPIVAAADGTVLEAGFDAQYGNYILLDHGSGVSTRYAHCDALSVAEGDTVIQGQAIATVGSTGNATGPHLHFEVHLNGAAVDPYPHVGG